MAEVPRGSDDYVIIYGKLTRIRAHEHCAGAFHLCLSPRSIMAKPHHSAHHPVKSSSSDTPKGSSSKSTQLGIIIAAVIVGLLLIPFCYCAMQGRLFIYTARILSSDINEAYQGFVAERHRERNK